jgi:hypothetical protein
MAVYECVTPDGWLDLPLETLAAAGIKPGDDVRLTLEDGVLRISALTLSGEEREDRA